MRQSLALLSPKIRRHNVIRVNETELESENCDRDEQYPELMKIRDAKTGVLANNETNTCSHWRRLIFRIHGERGADV